MRQTGGRDDRHEHHDEGVDIGAGHRGPDRRGQLVGADVHLEVLGLAVGDPQSGVQAGIDGQHAQGRRVPDHGDPVTGGHRLG